MTAIRLKGSYLARGRWGVDNRSSTEGSCCCCCCCCCRKEKRAKRRLCRATATAPAVGRRRRWMNTENATAGSVLLTGLLVLLCMARQAVAFVTTGANVPTYRIELPTRGSSSSSIGERGSRSVSYHQHWSESGEAGTAAAAAEGGGGLAATDGTDSVELGSWGSSNRRQLLQRVGAGITAGAGAAALMPAEWPWGGESGGSVASAADNTLLCDDAVSHLIDPNSKREVYIVGTAHISNISALLVQDTIRLVRPDTVMLELDASRVSNSTSVGPPSASSTRGSSSSSSGSGGGRSSRSGGGVAQRSLMMDILDPRTSWGEKVVNIRAAVVGNAISNLYTSLDRMGFSSGDEFVVAAREARGIGADVLLGDRDLRVTLRRLSEALSGGMSVNINNLGENYLRLPEAKTLEAAGPDIQEISRTVEMLKQRRTVRAIMSEIQMEAPDLYNAMVKERDEYMANSLLQSKGRKMVAVVGIAHMDGIERFLQWRRVDCGMRMKRDGTVISTTGGSRAAAQMPDSSDSSSPSGFSVGGGSSGRSSSSFSSSSSSRTRPDSSGRSSSSFSNSY